MRLSSHSVHIVTVEYTGGPGADCHSLAVCTISRGSCFTFLIQSLSIVVHDGVSCSYAAGAGVLPHMRIIRHIRGHQTHHARDVQMTTSLQNVRRLLFMHCHNRKNWCQPRRSKQNHDVHSCIQGNRASRNSQSVATAFRSGVFSA